MTAATTTTSEISRNQNTANSPDVRPDDYGSPWSPIVSCRAGTHRPDPEGDGRCPAVKVGTGEEPAWNPLF
ncbi:hypothetical protein GCM10012287_29100 [Streptomyces daqingensis]|uniref:Uncharacterized protein n=1 Tax=Streptomyces daqingensis TaxID=1472640 RepID=A0ABQ2MDI2_9ACTN|nr:hypothetical protein GCM10012287_29100 [Streptomyces daqingensis]